MERPTEGSKQIFESSASSTKKNSGNTAKVLKVCEDAINKFTLEIRESRKHREQLRLRCLNEYKTLVKLSEESVKSTVVYRSAIIEQRQQKLELLKKKKNLLEVRVKDSK